MAEGQPVLLIHKRDGSVIRRFDSESAAARELQRDRRGLIVAMRDLTLQPGPHLLRLESRWEGREDFRRRAHNRPVIVLSSGRLQWFDGMKTAAEALCVSYDCLRAVMSERARSTWGIRARYAESTDDWPLLRADIAALAGRGVAPVDPLALGMPARVRKAPERKEGDVPAA